MPVRSAQAAWDGTLKEGKGRFEVESGAVQGAFSFGTRFQEEPRSNPEELIGAAHAGCFSMALSGDLEKAGYTPRSVRTTARVHLDKSDARGSQSPASTSCPRREPKGSMPSSSASRRARDRTARSRSARVRAHQPLGARASATVNPERAYISRSGCMQY